MFSVVSLGNSYLVLGLFITPKPIKTGSSTFITRCGGNVQPRKFLYKDQGGHRSHNAQDLKRLILFYPIYFRLLDCGDYKTYHLCDKPVPFLAACAFQRAQSALMVIDVRKVSSLVSTVLKLDLHHPRPSSCPTSFQFILSYMMRLPLISRVSVSGRAAPCASTNAFIPARVLSPRLAICRRNVA